MSLWTVQVAGSRSRKRRGEAGFTLLELLVVIVILGMLIMLVAPNVMRQFAGAKSKIVRESIENLTAVLDLYKLDIGSYPSTADGLQALVTQPSDVSNWHGPYVKGDAVPIDPWGRPFTYRNPSERERRDYDLCSLGPTGQAAGTGDNGEICN
jgi:general secretion pathway protein G